MLDSGRAMVFALAGALWLVAPLAAQDLGGHAPVERVTPARDERRETLSDMWERGILGSDMNQWSPQDLALLQRMRRVEAAGALGLLRRHFLPWKGLVLRDHPSDSRTTRLRLTRKGFEQYLALKSQEALAFFEARDIPTKWAYWLTDLEGRDLFDRGSGLLTEPGDELYSRAVANEPTYWRLRTGGIKGNRPLPPQWREHPPAPAAAPTR